MGRGVLWRGGGKSRPHSSGRVVLLTLLLTLLLALPLSPADLPVSLTSDL